MLPIFLALLALLAFLCPAVTATPPRCNNAIVLCNRTYDQITHMGAHDSPFLSDKKDFDSISGNQFYPSTTQLSAGVRLLSAQIHQSITGAWHLCHTSCYLLDAGPLVDWLGRIKTWLDNNPNEVVTILIVNDGANATTLDSIFQASGIVPYAYSPPSLSAPPSSWPTLAQLIAADTRLMVFIQPLDPASNTVAPYLMDEFTFVWENPYQVTRRSNFSCEPDRPPSLSGQPASAAFGSGRMALMNHFLDIDLGDNIDIPNQLAAPMTNAPIGSENSSVGSLGVWARRCRTEWLRRPTFILVDWYNLGPSIATADRLNGVKDPKGRRGPGVPSA